MYNLLKVKALVQYPMIKYLLSQKYKEILPQEKLL